MANKGVITSGSGLSAASAAPRHRFDANYHFDWVMSHDAAADVCAGPSDERPDTSRQCLRPTSFNKQLGDN